jgi:hypothetical protein
MSIDARGRDAARELRSATLGGTRMATITDLEKTRAQRGRTRTVLAATTAMAVIGGFGALVLVRTGPADKAVVPAVSAAASTPASSQSPSPGTATPNADAMAICSIDRISCLGGRSLRVDLPAPITVTLPPGVHTDGAQTASTSFELYAGGGAPNGVTVLEQASATAADAPSTADPTAGTSAQSAAAWLASRPFVSPTKVEATTLGGLPAFRVHVVLRPGAKLSGQSKIAGPTAATFTSGHYWSAVSAELRDATYYLVDLPNGGLTVVWSWSTGAPTDGRAAREAYVAALHFG